METFTEIQKFNSRAQVWMLTTTAFILLVFGVLLTHPVEFHVPIQGSGPPTALIVVALVGIFFLAVWLLRRMYLRIDVDGSEFRLEFHPYKPLVIPLGSIARAEAVTYRALRDCGGHGMRYGYKLKGRSFCVSGNRGVEITTREGKIILVGTQKQDELLRVLKARIV